MELKNIKQRKKIKYQREAFDDLKDLSDNIGKEIQEQSLLISGIPKSISLMNEEVMKI